MTMMKDDRVLLFMDDFNQIMSMRSNESTVFSGNEEIKEIVLHHVSRFAQEDLLMVGSATTLQKIDEEVLAPGRFDVHIPVFPPNSKERSEMILHQMTEGLSQDALLYKILENNQADHLPFWQAIADKMRAYSNTMIVDFTQSLKKRIRSIYHKTQNPGLKITDQLLEAARRDAGIKLTDEYLNQMAQFLEDVAYNNADDFPKRINELRAELNTYRVVEKPRRNIGFQHNVNPAEEGKG